MTRVLTKEILRSGRFVDRTGQELVVTPEELAAYAEGTAKLQDMGHEVVAYPSHVSESADEIVGVWGRPRVEGEGESARLVADLQVEPDLDDAEVERLKRRQVSCVVFEDYPTEQGQIPRAITRIDIVGSGAVMGLAPFTEARLGAVRFMSPRNLKTRSYTLSGPTPEPEKERPMKTLAEMMSGLRALMGVDEKTSDDQVITAFRALMPPAAKECSEPPADDKKAEEAKKEAAALSAQLAERDKRIAALEKSAAEEREKRERGELESGITARLSALAEPIGEEKLKEIRNGYDELRALGHEKAMKHSLSLLEAHAEGLKRRVLSGQPIPRPPQGKPPAAPAKNPLVEAAEGIYGKRAAANN